MNILSLFDGMSCGRIALERAGIKVDKYYASEIEKPSIEVSKDNWPDIIQLGDVTKWREWSIHWENIDLLIGGSPCQGFSFAGKQLALDDERSKLFFVYADILNYIRGKNPNVKFLLENVYMKKQDEEVISMYVGTTPVKINSNICSAQNRRRVYWTNILLCTEKYSIDTNPCNLSLNDIRSNNIDDDLYLKGKGLNKLKSKRSRVVGYEDKAPCLMATQSTKPTDAIVIKDEVGFRYPTRLEMERMQTVPDGYTNCVKYNDAAKMLGNGWTVDVIAHILKGIKLC